MAKRRANGEGNIRKRKDGRWEGRYTLGHDPDTGKAVVKNVLGKTQAEVREKLAAALEANRGLDTVRANGYTLGQWLEVWYEHYAKVKMRYSSYTNYRGYIDNHIKPNIGDVPLTKLTTLDLQKFYQHLLTDGRVERIESRHQPKGLSAKTVKNMNQIIKSAYKLAIAQKLVGSNPTDGCALPRQDRKEMQTLHTDELEAFFKEAKASGFYELYYLDLVTGLRRGELLGLKWTDVDLQSGIIQIRRQIYRIDGVVKEMPLKTKNAYRSVMIGTEAIEILKGKKLRDNGRSPYVFCSPTGGAISPDSVTNMLHRVLKRAGLPKLRFHDLRHTFATLAIQNGVDIKTVSGMLGHFSAGFTLDAYTHVTTPAQREAAAKMNGVLSNLG